MPTKTEKPLRAGYTRRFKAATPKPETTTGATQEKLPGRPARLGTNGSVARHDTNSQSSDTPLKPDLTGVPAKIADFVADMVVRGSSSGNISLLIYSCLEHQYRCFEFADSMSREEIDEGAKEWVSRHVVEWSDALAAFRQSRKRIPQAIRPEPATVSERIRAAAKDELLGKVQNFVRMADPEDVALMTNILMDWESQNAMWGAEPSKESALASGFEYALGSDQTYVRVPRHLADHIASYANALMNATGMPEVPSGVKGGD